MGFVSLGCPKNLVDSEVMMGLLDRAGARLTARPEDAEILVVNTCSFIDTAKQESVDTILEMARHKSEGRAKKLIVAGCLVERYRDEIRKNIPEVDAVVGTGELEAILEAAGLRDANAGVYGLGGATEAPSPFNILTRCRGGSGGKESQAGSHKLSQNRMRRRDGSWPAQRAAQMAGTAREMRLSPGGRRAGTGGAVRAGRMAGRGASLAHLSL